MLIQDSQHFPHSSSGCRSLCSVGKVEWGEVLCLSVIHCFVHHQPLMIILTWICQDVQSVSKILQNPPKSCKILQSWCGHSVPTRLYSKPIWISHPPLSHTLAYLGGIKDLCALQLWGLWRLSHVTHYLICVSAKSYINSLLKLLTSYLC